MYLYPSTYPNTISVQWFGSQTPTSDCKNCTWMNIAASLKITVELSTLSKK